MIQFTDNKFQPEYLSFNRTEMKFGDKTINVYHLEVPIYTNFHKTGFMIRLLDDTGTISNYDYYDKYDFYRQFNKEENTFLFDMQILLNYYHYLYIGPPSTSIVDLFD